MTCREAFAPKNQQIEVVKNCERSDQLDKETDKAKEQAVRAPRNSIKYELQFQGFSVVSEHYLAADNSKG